MPEIHNIPPVYFNNSSVLILGSFPSVKSREEEFFYAHPQNRFWVLLSRIFNQSTPKTIYDKKQFLYKNKIALWDVIASCSIKGSSDSSIKDIKPNDLSVILENCDIKKIFTNGATAHKLYNKYLKNQTGREAILLPSTSHANARFSLDLLFTAWQVINNN